MNTGQCRRFCRRLGRILEGFDDHSVIAERRFGLRRVHGDGAVEALSWGLKRRA